MFVLLILFFLSSKEKNRRTDWTVDLAKDLPEYLQNTTYTTYSMSTHNMTQEHSVFPRAYLKRTFRPFLLYLVDFIEETTERTPFCLFLSVPKLSIYKLRYAPARCGLLGLASLPIAKRPLDRVSVSAPFLVLVGRTGLRETGVGFWNGRFQVSGSDPPSGNGG